MFMRALYTAPHSVRALVVTLVFMPTFVGAEEGNWKYDFDGHTKLRYTYQHFPEDSVFYQFTGSGGHDAVGNLRLNLGVKNRSFDADISYELFALYGDQVEMSRDVGPGFGLNNRLPNDERRLFNLTDVIEDEGKLAVVQRLDRLSVGYTGKKSVVRFGRQALSWGNGLFYAPMDVVNPFDPATVDTEYKVGDDMLYGQFLQSNGNDTQAAAVFRRDLITGDVDKDSSTLAAKYHGFTGFGEYDVFLAQNYADPMAGFGGNINVGGAVWRADFIVTDAEKSGTTGTLVTNYSYSWVWGGKNVSGFVEYFFNGFGQRDGHYDNLAENTDLIRRLARGELFTLGRHYIGGSLLVEMTPLWTLTPNIFTNLSDGSALAQLVTQHNMSDNILVIGALNVPVGLNGTEFGGLESGVPDTYISQDLSAFLQFAWYF